MNLNSRKTIYTLVPSKGKQEVIQKERSNFQLCLYGKCHDRLCKLNVRIPERRFCINYFQ